ncbi:hypothetical protein B5C34_08705 [Pacificimonas flava]|uniref:Uncharacterized protein n=2 Tax=Pacificimonas TaxID=1960290 RepID=A0A219B5H3_9SPHN|nr:MULTISPECIES: hypothetical protein [Pacificimonas]MBZ6379257.1 hypothetical protein [Pacificimonas aurantium]OWV33531.1 hypothetical protein B5C34_08705 [Pacificimonas flava]
MLGKFIGATIGRKVARQVGTAVGGPAGAAIGYGLASRRFRKLALGGLAVVGGLAAVRSLKDGPLSKYIPGGKAEDSGVGDLPETNKDPLPAYAPHS